MTAHVRRLARTGLLLLAMLLGAALPAAAQDISAALAKLATDSYADTGEAIGLLATSGHPRAGAIVEAIRDGAAEFDAASKTIAIRAGGKVVDAATGAEIAAPPAGLSPVRVNNRVRGAIAGAMGALTLMAPDPAKRRGAAEARGAAGRRQRHPVVPGRVVQRR